MTASHSAAILDVGHGNAIVLLLGGANAIVDIKQAGTLLDFLREQKIATIDALVLTHSDADHIAGAQAFLLAQDIEIRRVYLNTDADKATRIWNQLRRAIADWSIRNPSGLRTSINAGDPGAIPMGDVSLTILSPTREVMLLAPGAVEDGHLITPNDHSVVLLVSVYGRNVMLLLSDITPWSWQRIAAAHADLKVDVVVLPHHGGHFGTTEEYEALLVATKPQFAVVSNGRSPANWANPRAEVVRLVRATGAQLACTQLGHGCGERPATAAEREPLAPACAGDVHFLFGEDATTFSGEAEHTAFVNLIAHTALCRV